MIKFINRFYGCFCCLILCCDFRYALTPSKAPIDFTVVEDSTVNKVKKSSDGLPLDVAVNFNVLGRPVQLQLKRNPKLENVNGVYAIKKLGSGIPVVIQQRLQRDEVFGEYQDTRNKAIFTLSCPHAGTNQTCDAVMEGTFRAGQKEYRMKLMDDNGSHRVRRAASKLWKKAKTIVLNGNADSKVYGIYETNSSTATPSDYKDTGPIISGKVAAAFGRSAKIVRDDVMPGGREYNLEILALIDYGMYQRFYKASERRTEKERDNEAKINIQRYFSHVFNGVDMMYKSIDDTNFGISVAVSGFIIADSPETSPWSTPMINRVRDGRDELLVNEALDALIRWSFEARNIPENDHIMLITDYDLYSLDNGSKDVRTAGYARVASVCSLDSVSIIEDHGGFQSINAAAHELGHGLGARHDGNANSCNPSDQFIMTAHGGFETEKTKTNPWKFSKCSVDYFKKYIRGLRRNCLADPVDVFDEFQFSSYLSNYPGQMLTPNEQCQDILGLESYFGWGRELGGFSDICTSMSCSIPGSGRSFRIFKAATGTSCGDKMWCQSGRCVFDERAPIKSPTCVFGDMQKRFGQNRSCRQYMLERPLRCYDTYYSTRCCDTCEKLNTGVPDCEYGDKYLRCRKSGCYDPQYRRRCCSTCGIAPHPVLRPTTPTTLAPPIGRPVPTRPPYIPTAVKTTRKPPVVPRRTRPTPKRTTKWFPDWTTKAPRKTSTSNIVTERPKNSKLLPSGTKGLCLRLNDKFLMVFTCSSLTDLFGKNACDNDLIGRYCCEKCPKPEPPTSVCVDTPECKFRHSRDCYVAKTREQCCRSCKNAETSKAGCKYGDRIRSCERYVGGLGTKVVCGKYKKYCCGLCSALPVSNNDSTSAQSSPVIPEVVMADHSNHDWRYPDQPSTFVARDPSGNLLIIGTGRDRGISNKNKRIKNKSIARKGNNKKRGNGGRNRNKGQNQTGLKTPRGPARTGSMPIQTFTLTSRPNQRPSNKPRERLEPMQNFRIVFTGK